MALTPSSECRSTRRSSIFQLVIPTEGFSRAEEPAFCSRHKTANPIPLPRCNNADTFPQNKPRPLRDRGFAHLPKLELSLGSLALQNLNSTLELIVRFDFFLLFILLIGLGIFVLIRHNEIIIAVGDQNIGGNSGVL